MARPQKVQREASSLAKRIFHGIHHVVLPAPSRDVRKERLLLQET
eukprot:CAMPEP_0170152762 /NCGR_PEP_ID=MMETSP0033_2-20121228/53441_1 /TAXON_ID=195969 /ORGANISM="Dolichomastix tenuilepis, Strain CCMP3274" /LENGTH=44 /DNA_ID= /DNA_START= /DNA_END= /DNA_ORIENTATION=